MKRSTSVSHVVPAVRRSASEDRFADFFLASSTEEKQQVFRKAAQQANQDQREVFRKAKLGLKGE